MRVEDQVGGPIAIFKQGAQASQAGLGTYAFFVAAISINLAILNLLPVPMLDGGHILILVIERIRRRDLSLKVKERIFQSGFVLLASLMLLVIAMDLWKLRH